MPVIFPDSRLFFETHAAFSRPTPLFPDSRLFCFPTHASAAPRHCLPWEQGTVRCKGRLTFKKHVQDQGELPKGIGLKIILNLETAFSFGQLPYKGIGLACLQLVVNNAISVHAGALLNYDSSASENAALVDKCLRGCSTPAEFCIKKICGGRGNFWLPPSIPSASLASSMNVMRKSP